MKTVIKHGTCYDWSTPSEIVLKGTCYVCDCEFECPENEAATTIGDKPGTFLSFAECPECRNTSVRMILKCN